MSRSGYDDCCDGWDLIRWKGAVASAIRGKRGQTFLKELLDAMDSLPAKRLIKDDLVRDGEVCAIGAIGVARGIPMDGLDPHDRESVAGAFGIPPALAAEIVYMNDEWGGSKESPESTFVRMRNWIESAVKHT